MSKQAIAKRSNMVLKSLARVTTAQLLGYVIFSSSNTETVIDRCLVLSLKTGSFFLHNVAWKIDY
jgi:hypothetical protein